MWGGMVRWRTVKWKSTHVDDDPLEAEVLHAVRGHRLGGLADLAVIAGVRAALADGAPRLPAEEWLEAVAIVVGGGGGAAERQADEGAA